MTLKGSLRHEIRTPGYWTESYFSNHFVWSNSFSKESETRFSVTFSAPQIGLELGGYQSLLGDRIYYGADSVAGPVRRNRDRFGLVCAKGSASADST